MFGPVLITVFLIPFRSFQRVRIGEWNAVFLQVPDFIFATGSVAKTISKTIFSLEKIRKKIITMRNLLKMKKYRLYHPIMLKIMFPTARTSH